MLCPAYSGLTARQRKAFAIEHAHLANIAGIVADSEAEFGAEEGYYFEGCQRDLFQME